MASVDTLEDNTRFAKEHEADFPILADPSKNVAKAYGVIRTDVPPERPSSSRHRPQQSPPLRPEP